MRLVAIVTPSGMQGMCIDDWARIGHEMSFLRSCERLTAKNTGLTCADELAIESMRRSLEGWGSTIELHPQVVRRLSVQGV